MSTRRLLTEMAVYSENEIFAMEPVVFLNSNVTESLEGDELVRYIMDNIRTIQIPTKYKLERTEIATIIRHHCSHRSLKKAAMLAIPHIINSNYPTAPWRRRNGGKQIKTKDKRLSGMISAPIQINGVKYLCNLTIKKNTKGIISPYALTLKDANGNIIESEKMESHCQVHHSSSEPTTSGMLTLDNATTSLEANPSFQDANVQKDDEAPNQNNGNNKNAKEKTNETMVKRQKVSLNETQLRKIVSESVKRVLREDYDFNSDLEDGYSYLDREEFKYGPEETARMHTLAAKRDRSENYEKYRQYNLYDMDFLLNMLNKACPVNKERSKETILNTLSGLGEKLNILSFISFFLERGYKETGDERYLYAFQTISNIVKKATKNEFCDVIVKIPEGCQMLKNDKYMKNDEL